MDVGPLIGRSLQLLLTLFVLLFLNPRVYQWLLLFFLFVNAVRLSVTLSSGFGVVLMELLMHLWFRFLMDLLPHIILLFSVFTDLLLMVDLSAHIDSVLNADLVVSNAFGDNIPDFVDFAHLNQHGNIL